MRKLFIPVLFFLLYTTSSAQLTLQLNLPPTGLSVKQQLWNLIVTNSTNSTHTVRIELRLTEISSSMQVMNASTNSISITPGTQVLQANHLVPIQYSSVDPAYQSFIASDFLPVGHFIACYSIWKLAGDRIDKIVEDCQEILIEPLSPPQLILPLNQDTVETLQPVFNWLPPSPAQLFSGMNYDLELVEQYTNQAEADAIQQNIILYKQSGITGTSMPYPGGAPSLEPGKKYAWRVLVKNNQGIITSTEAWSFVVKPTTITSISDSPWPYAKLKKGAGLNYTIAQDEVKFEYLNETADTSWNAILLDISNAREPVKSFSLDSIRMRPGQNFVRLYGEQVKRLTHKHLYLLQLENSRKEVYSLKFEFRRKENN